MSSEKKLKIALSLLSSILFYITMSADLDVIISHLTSLQFYLKVAGSLIFGFSLFFFINIKKDKSNEK